jgi:hypothetical protein
MVQTSGMPPIDTSQLTPEQRARIEAMMSQRQGQAKPETRRECLTQERLDKLLFQDPKDTSCKQTPVSMSATSAEVKIACTGENGMSATGTVHVDAPTPETVKGQATMTSSGGGNTMNMHSTFTARWVSADCGSVK